MIEEYRGERADKESVSIIEAIEEHLGTTLEITKATPLDRSYTFTADGIDRLDLIFTDDEIRILNIEVTNQGAGYGAQAVEAIIATAEEIGIEVWAEDVKPESDAWWRQRGFAPRDEGSADYIYSPHSSE